MSVVSSHPFRGPLLATLFEPAGIYSTAAVAEPQRSASRWLPEIEVAGALHSIRVPVPAGEVRCPECNERFLAAGPTGYSGDRPICDLCLLEASHPLGMLLALSAVTRAIGTMGPQAHGQDPRVLEEVAAFARIYELIAARSAPPRPFGLLDPKSSEPAREAP